MILVILGLHCSKVLLAGCADKQFVSQVLCVIALHVLTIELVLVCALEPEVIFVQVMQAKKQLLDKLHAEVADKEDLPLKRMLCEDDSTMKRREQCQTRVQLLRKAAEEISSVSF